jgi:hypothetical protein
VKGPVSGEEYRTSRTKGREFGASLRSTIFQYPKYGAGASRDRLHFRRDRFDRWDPKAARLAAPAGRPASRDARDQRHRHFDSCAPFVAPGISTKIRDVPPPKAGGSSKRKIPASPGISAMAVGELRQRGRCSDYQVNLTRQVLNRWRTAPIHSNPCCGRQHVFQRDAIPNDYVFFTT